MAGRVWPTQEAHRARQMAGRPRGHVGARVGRHVSRSREEILGQLIGESSPLFNHVLPLYFFRVGLCSTRSYLLQVTWRLGGRRIGSERRRSRGPESTRSLITTRAENGDLSATIGGLTDRHVATGGEPIFIKN